MPGAAISELLPKRRSRLQQVMDGVQVDVQQTQAYFDEFARLKGKALDWTNIHSATFKQYIVFADDFDHWYREFYRKQYPSAQLDPWNMQSSQDMADCVCAFLLFRILHTSGRSECGRIRVQTLRIWSQIMLFLAAYHLTGRGYELGGRKAAVLRGTLPDRSDCLWNLIKLWTSSTATDMNLPRHAAKSEFFGPREAMILIRRIQQLAVCKPARANSLIQLQSFIQLLLLLGVRPNSICPPSLRTSANKKAFLRECDLVFTQVEPGVYEVQISFLWMKGFSAIDDDAAVFCPVLPPVTKPENLQFEFSSTAIAMLVARGVLFTQTSAGKHFFEDIDEFLQSTARNFYVDSELPLIRSLKRPFELTEQGMSSSNAQRQLLEISIECRLPKAKCYNFRKGLGAFSRVIGGRSGQEVDLHHGAQDDPGRNSYSAGVADSATARRLLGEWLPGEEEIQRKLELSRHERREEDSRAVQSMILLKRHGLGQTSGNVSITDEDVLAEVAQDPTYIRLAAELASASASVSHSEADSTKRLKREMGSMRTQARKKLSRDAEQKFRAEEGVGERAVYGTLGDYAEAKAAVDLMAKSLPLLLTQRPDIDFDSAADFAQFRCATVITPAQDPTITYIETEDDAELELPFDPEQLGFMSEQDNAILSQTLAQTAKTPIPISKRVPNRSLVGDLHPTMAKASRGEKPVKAGTKRKAKEAEDESDEDDEEEAGGVVQQFTTDLHIFDDRQDPTPSTHAHLDVVQLRRRYIKSMYDVLRARTAREQVNAFFLRNRYCPWCEPAVLGTRCGSRLMGIATGDGYKLWEHARVHHREVHELIVQGILPPINTGPCTTQYTPEVWSGMVQVEAEGQLGHLVSVSTDDSDMIKVIQASNAWITSQIGLQYNSV